MKTMCTRSSYACVRVCVVSQAAALAVGVFHLFVLTYAAQCGVVC